MFCVMVVFTWRCWTHVYGPLIDICLEDQKPEIESTNPETDEARVAGEVLDDALLRATLAYAPPKLTRALRATGVKSKRRKAKPKESKRAARHKKTEYSYEEEGNEIKQGLTTFSLDEEGKDPFE